VVQDVLRLLTLWFRHGARPDVEAALVEGLASLSIDTWLDVIPQVRFLLCLRPSMVWQSIRREDNGSNRLEENGSNRLEENGSNRPACRPPWCSRVGLPSWVWVTERPSLARRSSRGSTRRTAACGG